MNAPVSTPTKEAPLLPPAPWWTSEVQVRAVIAVAAQLISVLLRMVGRYTEVSLSTDDIDAVTADILQIVAIVFGGLAIIKRKDSEIQPLTLSRGSAASHAHTAQLNPVTFEKKHGGFARVFMLALLLGIAAPAFMSSVGGCTTTQSMSFDQRLKLTIDTHTAVTRTVTSALDARLISSKDAEAYNKLAVGAREVIDAAVSVKDSDISTAEGQLQLANELLIELQKYLAARGAQS